MTFNRHILLQSIWLAGYLQTIVIVLQKFHIIQSFSLWFNVSGTFSNPAHSAIIIVVSMVILSQQIVTREMNKLTSAVLYVLLAFQGVSLVFCGTRSCILAFSLTTYALTAKEYFPNKKKIVFFFAILLLTLGLFLYLLNPNSANARILIWRVCLNLIAQRPFWGYGANSFQYHYMYSQAEFFAAHPDSSLSFVANNVFQSYNDLLYILFAYGLVGLMLSLTCIITLLKRANDFVKYPIITLLVISQFLNILIIKEVLLIFFTLIFLLIAEAISNKIISKRKCNFTFLFSILGLFLIISPIIDLIYHYQHRENDIYNIVTTQPIPTYEWCCNKGTKFVNKNEYTKAEEMFNLATNMIPNRLYAHYLLFELYVATDKQKAILQAEKVVSHKVTVFGDATIRMKRNALEWLKSNTIPDFEAVPDTMTSQIQH